MRREGEAQLPNDCSGFEATKELFLFDYKAIAEMEDIPPALVLNWDPTGINIVPGSS